MVNSSKLILVEITQYKSTTYKCRESGKPAVATVRLCNPTPPILFQLGQGVKKKGGRIGAGGGEGGGGGGGGGGGL